MIILSVGLPKSGSAWYYYMTNDLVVAAGHDDAGAVRDKFALHGILKFPTCNIQEPTADKLELLMKPPVTSATFTVKTHFPPNGALLDLLAAGNMKVTVMIRDPRDIAVSGYEAGEAMRRQGKTGTFANIHSLSEAILWAEKWLATTWLEWSRIDGILMVKYEDVLRSPVDELRRLNDFLGFGVPSEPLEAIATHWSKDTPSHHRAQRGHFNKGVSGRHRQAMNEDEQDLCRERLGTYIAAMGYEMR